MKQSVFRMESSGVCRLKKTILKRKKRKEKEVVIRDWLSEVPVASVEPFLIPVDWSLTLTPSNLGHSCVAVSS